MNRDSLSPQDPAILPPATSAAVGRRTADPGARRWRLMPPFVPGTGAPAAEPQQDLVPNAEPWADAPDAAAGAPVDRAEPDTSGEPAAVPGSSTGNDDIPAVEPWASSWDTEETSWSDEPWSGPAGEGSGGDAPADAAPAEPWAPAEGAAAEPWIPAEEAPAEPWTPAGGEAAEPWSAFDEPSEADEPWAAAPTDAVPLPDSEVADTDAAAAAGQPAPAGDEPWEPWLAAVEPEAFDPADDVAEPLDSSGAETEPWAAPAAWGSAAEDLSPADFPWPPAEEPTTYDSGMSDLDTGGPAPSGSLPDSFFADAFFSPGAMHSTDATDGQHADRIMAELVAERLDDLSRQIRERGFSALVGDLDPDQLSRVLAAVVAGYFAGNE